MKDIQTLRSRGADVSYGLQKRPPDLLIKRGDEPDTAYAINDVYQGAPEGDQIETWAVPLNFMAIYDVKVENDSGTGRTFIIKAEESPEAGWTVLYKVGDKDISEEIRSEKGYKTVELAPGAGEIITVMVMPGGTVPLGAVKVVTLRIFLDEADKAVRDAIQIKTTATGVLMAFDDRIQFATVKPDVDEVRADAVIQGRYGWRFWIHNAYGEDIHSPKITVDSALDPTYFPGIESFPVSEAVDIIPPGGVFHMEKLMVSTCPASFSPGFYSLRALDPLSIPPGGSEQKVTVKVVPGLPCDWKDAQIWVRVGGEVVEGSNTQPEGAVVEEISPKGISWRMDRSAVVADSSWVGTEFIFSVKIRVYNPTNRSIDYKPPVTVRMTPHKERIDPAFGWVELGKREVFIEDDVLGKITYFVNEDRNWRLFLQEDWILDYEELDLIPPPAPVVKNPEDGTKTRDTSITVHGEISDPGLDLPVTITVLVDGVPEGSIRIEERGATIPWTIENMKLTGNSVNTITAVSEDVKGNKSDPSGPVHVISDQIPPAKPVITSPVTGATLGTTSAMVFGEVDIKDELSPPITIIVYVGGIEKGRAEADKNGRWRIPVILIVGENRITAKAVDGAGNEGPLSSEIEVEVIGVRPIVSIVAARTTSAASNPSAGYVWKKGQKVQMKVWAEGLVNVNAAGFVLKYDPAILKIVDVVGGEQFGDLIYTDDPERGILDMSVAVLGEGMKVTGNTTLAMITFEVQTEAVGQTDLVLYTATLFDIYGNEIAATKVNGAIRIIKLLGDFNGDGAVNIADSAILKKYYGKAVGATLPDGTKVPADQVKAGMMVDDPPAGDGKWDTYELRMLATQWGWDWKALNTPGNTVDTEEKSPYPVFRGVGLKADRSRIVVGETISVELLVDAAGMSAGRVVLKYDPSKLQFVGSGAGEIPFAYNTPGAGTITVDFAPVGDAIGKVASFTFKAIGAGYPGLKVESSVMWDIAGNEISGPVAEADLVIGSAELAEKEKEGIGVGKLELRALYPNPASDYVVVPILSPKGSITKVVVATVSGQVLKEEVFEIKAGVNQVVIDLSGIAPGTYRVIVKVDGKVLVKNLAVR
jgi:hypothetical protein